MSHHAVSFTLNRKSTTLWIEASDTLADALRDAAGSTEVKYGCGEGVCGTCTVILDSELVSACTILAVQVQGRSITTVRGLVDDAGGLHPLQRSFLDHGASQCGFCTPGMLLTAHVFTRSRQSATRDEIKEALSGNFCRCTGYTAIVDAIEAYLGNQGKPSG